MPFTPGTSATNENIGPTATKTATCSAVSIGDVVNVAITFDFSGTGKTGVITDSLGNTYTRTEGIEDVPRTQRLETWYTIVTNAGTPTVQVQFTPTPGTSVAGNLSINVDPAAGSDASSTADGHNSQLQATPGTGTDGVSSNSFTTTVNGCQIYCATTQQEGGGNPGTPGTNFTLGIASTGDPILKTEYRTQASAGSVSGTFTAAANQAHLTAAHAIKPAGGAAPSAPPLRDTAHTPQYQSIISQ